MPKRPTNDQYRDAARELYHEEGELEFDTRPTISKAKGGRGAYVNCWRWLDDDDVKSCAELKHMKEKHDAGKK